MFSKINLNFNLRKYDFMVIKIDLLNASSYSLLAVYLCVLSSELFCQGLQASPVPPHSDLPRASEMCMKIMSGFEIEMPGKEKGVNSSQTKNVNIDKCGISTNLRYYPDLTEKFICT